MSDIQEEQKRLYKRAEENDKTNKTLLDMKLLLKYYKNNNILDHYYIMLGDNDDRLVMDKEVINNLENVNEKIYITTFKKHIELQNRIDKAIEYINKYKNQNWYIESRFTEELLDILKGDNK